MSEAMDHQKYERLKARFVEYIKLENEIGNYPNVRRLSRRYMMKQADIITLAEDCDLNINVGIGNNSGFAQFDDIGDYTIEFLGYKQKGNRVMGYHIYSPPGHEFGPCAEDCDHLDCKATRAWAGTACPFCDEIIGYERAFYFLNADESNGRGIAHAGCYIDHVESEKKAKESRPAEIEVSFDTFNGVTSFDTCSRCNRPKVAKFAIRPLFDKRKKMLRGIRFCDRCADELNDHGSRADYERFAR